MVDMNSTEEIFHEIYKRYKPALCLVAKNKLIPHSEIEDMVQETFLSFYTHYEATWSEYRIQSLLMRIMQNLCADYYRAKSTHPTFYIDFSTWDIEELSRNSSSTQDPLDIVIKRQEIYDLIMTMKKEWITVFLLSSVYGMSIEEISKSIGISEAACKMRLMRGRRYLNKQKLKKHNGTTLVEVITILVILAVLTTIIIPSLFGFINKIEVQYYIAKTKTTCLLEK